MYIYIYVILYICVYIYRCGTLEMYNDVGDSLCHFGLGYLLLFYFSLKAGAGAVPTRRHETQPFRTKRGSIAKNWGKSAICKSSGATLSHEMRFDRQKLR